MIFNSNVNITNNSTGGEQATPVISVDHNGLITATAGNKKATHQLPTKGSESYTPGELGQIIAHGQYLTGPQIIAGDEDLKAENIKSGVNIFGIDGEFVGSGGEQATPVISVGSNGLITAKAGDKKATYQLNTTGGIAYKPGASDQTISAGQYLIKDITVLGDEDLIAENIKSGVQIFDVTGAYVGASEAPVITVDNTGLVTAVAGDKSSTKQIICTETFYEYTISDDFFINLTKEIKSIISISILGALSFTIDGDRYRERIIITTSPVQGNYEANGYGDLDILWASYSVADKQYDFAAAEYGEFVIESNTLTIYLNGILSDYSYIPNAIEADICVNYIPKD